eukprot:g17172.t1
MRCCVALLDQHRDCKAFTHNYGYSSCLWALQFGTRSFFLNKDIVPTLRAFADVKMPTFIVPFKKTSRASYSLKAGAATKNWDPGTTGCDPPNKRVRFHRYRSKKPDHVVTSDPKFLAALKDPKQKVLYFIHGGGYVVCSTQTHRGLVYNLVHNTESLLFTLNYRRPPDVDIVVTIDDCVRGCVILISPWVDFTSSELSDASFVVNRKLDIFRPEGVKRFANIVAQGY